MWDSSPQQRMICTKMSHTEAKKPRSVKIEKSTSPSLALITQVTDLGKQNTDCVLPQLTRSSRCPCMGPTWQP